MKYKHQAELVDRVRAILLRYWDPLDIGENAALRDEYDGFLSSVVKLLREGSSSAAFVAALQDIEVELGCTVSPEKRAATVEKLIDLGDDTSHKNKT
jgi:hypothetical protein